MQGLLGMLEACSVFNNPAWGFLECAIGFTTRFREYFLLKNAEKIQILFKKL